ncbi:MAG: cytochrome b [Betaproteobacteria bacterium]
MPIALANTPRRYGVVALALHWLMAALLVALVAFGVIMVGLPDAGFDTRKIMLILWHKQLGVAAFALVSARWLWRLGNPLPALAGGLAAWQRFAARFVHLCLYGLMVGLPASGWVMSSAAAIPVSFLGLFTLPDLVGRDDTLFRALIAAHRWAAWALVALVVVHAGAALFHHVVRRDDTLRRMTLPA